MSLRMAALALALAVSAAHADEEKTSTLKDQQSVAVTIYNENLALVKDNRKVRVEAGENMLAWRDVSARIRPETALLRDTKDEHGVRLIEQNFDFDLLTPAKLLEKYVGREVRVIRTNPATGEETTEAAKVLATNGGVVLQYADRIETGVPGRLAFADVPKNLRDRPTLVITMDVPKTCTPEMELSYLTGGLSWKADYVAELSPDDGKLDLNGWVTLTNQSGTTYGNAKLQLVAGDVNQVREEMRMDQMRPMVAKAAAPAPQMAEEALFEYHLYTLVRPTTIKENQTKQVALLSANAVPVRKTFELRGADYYYSASYGDLGQKLKIGVFVEFDNKEASGMGVPMPKGVVRVYKKDSAGNAQFVGEDRIDHTPRNETVRLKLGDAFDVTARKKQTDFKKLAGTSRYNYVYESAYEIEIKNAKTDAVTVKVIEPMPGDWEVVSESHPHKKEAAGTTVWEVPVPSDGSVTLTYRVRVRY
jgi:hypothetical protein